MEEQSKKWYSRWWFALLCLVVGLVIGWLLNHFCYLGGESGINL